MMVINKAPFPAEEVIFFDKSKLTVYLNFIEKNLCLASSEIVDIRRKIACLDDIKQEIKDIHMSILSLNKKLDANEVTLFNHHQKLLDLESDFRLHDHRIKQLETSTIQAKTKLLSIDDNLKSLNPITEDNVKNIEKLSINVEANTSDIKKSNIIIDSHVVTLSGLSEEINYFNKKMKKKKVRFNEKMIQITKKFNEIDTNISIILENIEIEDNSKVKVNKIEMTNNSDENKKVNLDRDEYRLFTEKTNKAIVNLDNEINELKKSILEEKEKEIHSLYKHYPQTKSRKEDGNTLEILNELQKNEKFIISNLFNKVEKEDLDKVTKALSIEIERINQRLNTFHGNHESSKENQAKRLLPEIKETQMDFKNLFHKLINEDEKLNKAYNSHDLFTDEINKLYESILDIRNQLKSSIRESYVNENFGQINSKINDFEERLNANKFLIETLSKSDTMIENSSIGITAPTSLKDYVKALSTAFKTVSEKVERNSSKIDNLNSEVLAKIRKDLITESNKVLDDFRLDLKSNIYKIQEQMREKVDKINMDDFSRKFEVKLLTEMGKKLDRTDLKKNTSLINKKIESLETKISKTLVDTLIDLQLDDAPLLVKKSNKGDKCGSCNQFVPNNTSSNMLNQHNYQMNNEFEKNIMMATMNNASTNTNNLLKMGPSSITNRNKNRDVIDQSLKSSASAINLNMLPEISTNTLNATIQKPKKISKEVPLTPQKRVNKNPSYQPIKYLDEFAERQLNNMINEELEKDFVRPELMIRASNKIIESLDRKHNK